MIRAQPDPLRPAVVVLVDGGELARPVVAKAESLQLRAKGVHRLLRRDGRVHPGLNRVLLGGQTEGVESHRVKDVEPFMPLESADDVGGGIALGMANMQSRPGWIREHVDAEILGLGRIEAVVAGVRCIERAAALPIRLPARFDLTGQATRVSVTGRFVVVLRSRARLLCVGW